MECGRFPDAATDTAQAVSCACEFSAKCRRFPDAATDTTSYKPHINSELQQIQPPTTILNHVAAVICRESARIACFAAPPLPLLGARAAPLGSAVVFQPLARSTPKGFDPLCACAVCVGVSLLSHPAHLLLSARRMGRFVTKKGSYVGRGGKPSVVRFKG